VEFTCEGCGCVSSLARSALVRRKTLLCRSCGARRGMALALDRRDERLREIVGGPELRAWAEAVWAGMSVKDRALVSMALSEEA